VISMIAFGGSSQTGKTTLARKLADLLQCKFASFGDYVRDEAKRRGKAVSARQDLQDIGAELAEQDMLSFCRDVLKAVNYVAGERIVIDGIRHAEALQALSKLSNGGRVRLIYLFAPLEVRTARTKIRQSDCDIRTIDAHPVESQTNSQIRAAADLLVDTSGPLDDVFARIANWVTQELL